jgi:hypothetical protein
LLSASDVFTGPWRASSIKRAEPMNGVDSDRDATGGHLLAGGRCVTSTRGAHAMQSITSADVPVALKDDNVEVRITEVGEMTIGYFRFAKGTDLRAALAGLPDDMCQCPHWGYMLEGKLLMRTPSGDHTYEAGQAFYWSPGHAPEALEDCAYVDFSPTAQLQEVLQHIQRAGD